MIEKTTFKRAKKPLIFANWKMHFTSKEAEKTTLEILKLLAKEKINPREIEIVLTPSFTALKGVAQLIKGTGLKLGAQDCFWEEKGSFTGEVSPFDLKELGVEYVIIGHSERRENLGETDGMIHKKIKAAFKANLVPLLCVGETFDERQKGIKDYKIMNQITRAFEGIKIKSGDRLIIAYEPVWVIGSGQAVAPEEAHYVNQVIKQRMIDLIGPALAEETTSFIYGGSVDENNIKNFMQCEIDGILCEAGVLVGGASLKAEQFVRLIKGIL